MVKLSEQTVKVLKNFATINPGLSVKPGSVLGTISPTKRILCQAEIPETFEMPFAISDLSKFLGVFSIFEEPDFQFFDRCLTVSEGDQKLQYGYGDTATMILPPPEVRPTPAPIVSFKLKASALETLLKAAKLLKQPEIAIIGSPDGEVLIQTTEVKRPSHDAYSVRVDGTASQFPFRFVYKVNNLLLIQGDYDIEAALDFSTWTSPGLRYLVAVEEGSKVGTIQ